MQTIKKILIILLTLFTLTSCKDSLLGDYFDEVTNSATLNISKEKDGYLLTVTLSNSYDTVATLTMHATQNKERLDYKGEKLKIVVTKDGKENISETVSNNIGYFEIVEDKLLWKGASHEEARRCIFAKTK